MTSVTLEGQDGIVLLGLPPSRADLVNTASNSKPFVGETLTFTLRFRRTDAATQTLRVRVADPNPALSYLEVLTPTITGGALYSPTIDGVIWESELVPESLPTRVTFQVKVTGTVPISGLTITNTATMVNLSRPDSPPLQIASALIHINRKLKHKLFLPLVFKRQ